MTKDAFAELRWQDPGSHTTWGRGVVVADVEHGMSHFDPEQDKNA